MICKKCGKEIKATAKFCGYCGSVNEPTISEQSLKISENVNYTPPWMKQEVKTTTGTVSAKQNTDIKTEISQNEVLFALPVIYLVWQIVRSFLNAYFIMSISYSYIATIVGCILFGAVSGGLVIAINNCSKNFKWVYLIPYVVVCGYYLISNLGYIVSIVYSVFEFLEIIISMAVIIAFRNTQIGKDNSLESTIIVAAISTGTGCLVFRFLYYILIKIIFGGYASFTGWNIITSAISILGAIIGASLAYNSMSTKKSNSTQR